MARFQELPGCDKSLCCVSGFFYVRAIVADSSKCMANEYLNMRAVNHPELTAALEFFQIPITHCDVIYYPYPVSKQICICNVVHEKNS